MFVNVVYGRDNSTDAGSASREEQGGVFEDLNNYQIEHLIREI